MAGRRVPVWPVWLLALPAAVSIWAGWVGLGTLTGFGEVRLLPGIWDGLRINTAVTLPIGMEAYAAYALRVWLSPAAPSRAREFARTSALSAMGLGMLGQVAYHLMAAAGWDRAPWLVTAVVACLPVAVLGMGATLAHLLGEDDEPAGPVSPAQPAPGAGVPPPATVAPARPVLPFPVVRSEPTPVVRSAGVPADRPVSPTGGPAVAGVVDRVPVRPADRSAARLADRPEPRPGDRSGPRTGSTPVRSGRRSGSARRGPRGRTDEQLAARVRELAQRNGGMPPSQYQIKQQLGVGSTRAARLLAELAAAPAGVAGKDGEQ